MSVLGMAAQKTNLFLVIGPNATGKSTFIKKHFSDRDVISLNVYDYQQRTYDQAGYGGKLHIPFEVQYKCLYQANNDLLTDIIDNLRQGSDVVVEQTFFKAKRRISFIDRIRKKIDDVNIVVYVMTPGDDTWRRYIEERQLSGGFHNYKSQAEQFEFPNPSEGFDAIFQVVDDNIQLRMDLPDYGLLEHSRRELQEEAERIRKKENEQRERMDLLESMNTRPFLHVCEVCGKREFISAQEATKGGWDYPPHIGSFGLLGPRTCGDCSLTDTLFWKVHQQSLPIVIESQLTKEEMITWRRIKYEPQSLLTWYEDGVQEEKENTNG